MNTTKDIASSSKASSSFEDCQQFAPDAGPSIPQFAFDNPQSAAAPLQTGVSTFQRFNDSTLPKLESAMLKLPQVTCPVTNHFAPGIYWREITIPAGAIALGHKHKTEHLNVLLSGRVRVLCDGQVKELAAPQVFSSPPGTRKIVLALEPVRWANVHANPTNEHDMEKLELIFVEKSAAYLAHEKEIAKLLNPDVPRGVRAGTAQRAVPTITNERTE